MPGRDNFGDYLRREIRRALDDVNPRPALVVILARAENHATGPGHIRPGSLWQRLSGRLKGTQRGKR